MIKSVIDNKEVKKELPFPKLMLSNSMQVVFFTDINNGVLLHTGVQALENTGFCGKWIMDNFTDFHGSITLSNEV